MKSVSAVLAGVVAVAAADSYGYESKPSSSSKTGYTTVYPGHGYEPVTVTSQYQTVPTYVSGKISEYVYVSTVITGYDGKPTTITKTDQDVVLYSTKSTITHYKTPAQGYAAPTGSYPTGGGYYPAKNGTKPSSKPYYELYEKVHEAKYKDLGPKALPGYPGSGLYKGDKDKQPVQVKEYKDGKWSAYTHVFDYGVPKPSATTYKNPGTYTIPAWDKTVKESYTAPAEAKTTWAPGKHTYGGYTITVAKPTTIYVTVPHKETYGGSEKTSYETKKVTCPTPGKYEVEKPKTTSVSKHTTFTYPTVTVYPPGVYHHTKETVTITKSNQPYTCHYQSTDKSTDSYPTKTSSTKGYESYPTTSSSSKGYDSYPTSSSSSGYDSYPTTSSTTSGYDSYPTTSSTSSGYDSYPTTSSSKTSPPYPDPSSDYNEPVENYGTPYAGYVKRGGVLERRKAEPEVKKAAGKRVILV